jgi:hypothetical protein
MLADALARLTAAIHLIACHEGGADPRSVRTVQQAADCMKPDDLTGATTRQAQSSQAEGAFYTQTIKTGRSLAKARS